MPINPANASELATIAREVGANVVGGNLRYQSGSWQLWGMWIWASTWIATVTND
jgi:hypothetical protein